MKVSDIGRIRPDRERNDHQLVWDLFPPVVSPYSKLQTAQSLDEAEAIFHAVLREKLHYFDMLSSLLSSNSIALSAETQEIDKINQFFVDYIYANSEKTDMASPWIQFSWIMGLFLGEVAISQARGLRRLRWVIRDVSIGQLGQSNRFVFRVGGYRSKSCEWRPDEQLVVLGRSMLKRKRGDLTAGGRFPDPKTMFSRLLLDSLEYAKD